MSNMGIERVVEMLMLYSSSPRGRLLCESAMTGDPYNVDIKLDNESTNIQAEILATYMKAIGFRLRFIKIPKNKVRPITKSIFKFFPSNKSPRSPFIFYDERETVDLKKVIDRAENLRKYKRPITVVPIAFTVTEAEVKRSIRDYMSGKKDKK